VVPTVALVEPSTFKVQCDVFQQHLFLLTIRVLLDVNSFYDILWMNKNHHGVDYQRIRRDVDSSSAVDKMGTAPEKSRTALQRNVIHSKQHFLKASTVDIKTCY
jgi:hypothetical protein